MIIVDVESSGVDAKLNSLLSVGALDFDNPTNQFYMECYAFEGAHIEREALVVAGFTREEIVANNQSPRLRSEASDGQANTNHQKKTDREVVETFLEWMKSCKEWTLVGQNPSFDRDFLQQTAHRYHINWPLAQRTIDLHSIAYWEFLRAGKEIPRRNNHSALNLDRILEHVGLPTRTESHNALDDAKLEGEALSRLLRGKVLLEEYSSFPVPAGLKG
ncbi:MAG: 3'-5' exonuclease [bacterium]|nr:3'-5' exonuclease [bacterium]